MSVKFLDFITMAIAIVFIASLFLFTEVVLPLLGIAFLLVIIPLIIRSLTKSEKDVNDMLEKIDGLDTKNHSDFKSRIDSSTNEIILCSENHPSLHSGTWTVTDDCVRVFI